MNPKRENKEHLYNVVATSSMAVKPGPTIAAESSKPWVIPAICILLAVITLAVFGQTVRFGFVNYDDNAYVYENPVVQKGLTWEGFRWAFTYGEIGHWHPLTWLTHMLDCQLYGLNAGGHHLTNIILHTASVIILFLVLHRMTGMIWRSAFVAAVFAVHPLRAESVAWVSERKDVLSGLFFMLTLWMYVRYVRSPRSVVRYCTVIIIFALGLLSKNMLVTLPFVLLLLDYWPLKRVSDFTTDTLVRLIIEKIPLFILMAASCVATFLVPEKVRADHFLPLVLRLENAVVSYVIYLWQMIYPSGLTCLYPNPTHLLPLWQVVGALGLLLGISGAVFVARKSSPWLIVGWLWYLGMMIPVIGIMQISYYAHADRYTYLPQIGLYVAITWTAAEIAAKWQVRRGVLRSLMGGLVIVLMACGWKQTTYWKNSVTLWTHTLACTSNNSIAHYCYGNVWLQEGQVDQAMIEFEKALAINPNDAQACYNLGTVLSQKGRMDEAIILYQRALAINPDYGEACNDLGLALFQKGWLDEAIIQFQKMLAITPNDAHVCYNLGNALLQKGQVDEAIIQFQRALAINSNFAQASYELGNALVRKRQVPQAIIQFRKTLVIDPDNTQACNNLASALVQEGRLDDAIIEFQKALAINPDNAPICYNLGSALLQKGRIDEAILQFQDALRLQPGMVAAQFDLTRIAWMLATSPNPSHRNGTKAVELAQQTDRLTGGGNPMMAATLAAADAAVGKFSEAITNAQRAILLASTQKETAMVAAFQAQLKCYQAGSPFRDSSTAP